MIVYTIPLYAYCFGRAITMYNITIGLEPLTILSFSIRAMCLNLYLKICTEHKGGFRVKQSA